MVDSAIIERRILDAAAVRCARSSYCQDLLFRGSFVTGLWIGRNRRPSEDLDFLALFPFDRTRVVEILSAALGEPTEDAIRFDCQAMEVQDIFRDTAFPGVRILVPIEGNNETAQNRLQIDVAFGDPLPLDPVHIAFQYGGNQVMIRTVVPEVGFAWKLHGLVEHEGLGHRAKDLADLWLMIQSVPMDSAKLQQAIRVAFSSRDGPLWRLDRLLQGKMGRSSRSQRQWRRLYRKHPEMQLPQEIGVVVSEVAEFTNPLVREFRYDAPPFAVNPDAGEMRAAIVGDKSFRSYPWENNGISYVYERVTKDAFPPPPQAATNNEFRRRQLRREARGITFDSDGVVIARPFPRFEALPETMTDSMAEQLQGGKIFEKLDGSLVFPTPVGMTWCLRTRRGRSEIADRAMAFAAKAVGDYPGLIEHCFSVRATPLFEWCSRSRPIVFDHPKDRLVLTAIRFNETGLFIQREQLESIASQFGIEIVPCLGTVECVSSLMEAVPSVDGSRRLCHSN